MQPLQSTPLQAHPNIAWGAVSNDGKVVGHRDWKEVVVIDSCGQTLFSTPEHESATHFVWADDGSAFAYVRGDENNVIVYKRQKRTHYSKEAPCAATTCAPLGYFCINNNNDNNVLMYETTALNRRGKLDTFTRVGQQGPELHVRGACANKTWVLGIDTDDNRLVGHPQEPNAQYLLFQPHPDDARPEQNCCATNGHIVAVAGRTTLRTFNCDNGDIVWQVPANVLGKPIFLNINHESILTLENSGHALVLRSVLTGITQHSLGVRFTLRIQASANGKFIVLNMGDGSTLVHDAMQFLLVVPY